MVNNHHCKQVRHQQLLHVKILLSSILQAEGMMSVCSVCYRYIIVLRIPGNSLLNLGLFNLPNLIASNLFGTENTSRYQLLIT